MGAEAAHGGPRHLAAAPGASRREQELALPPTDREALHWGHHPSNEQALNGLTRGDEPMRLEKAIS